MRISHFTQRGPCRWELAATEGMRAPALFFASPELMAGMDDAVESQIRGVASLPGIRGAAMVMPDAHLGYGFPIGGVAAFDPDEDGVVCAGGVGFDIACGVRCLRTGLTADDIRDAHKELADALHVHVPAGVGAGGAIRLSARELESLLAGGATWAVAQGYGTRADLDYIEENGRMPGADPDAVSATAKKRQRDQLGTLGGVSLIEKTLRKSCQSTH